MRCRYSSLSSVACRAAMNGARSLRRAIALAAAKRTGQSAFDNNTEFSTATATASGRRRTQLAKAEGWRRRTGTGGQGRDERASRQRTEKIPAVDLGPFVGETPTPLCRLVHTLCRMPATLKAVFSGEPPATLHAAQEIRSARDVRRDSKRWRQPPASCSPAKRLTFLFAHLTFLMAVRKHLRSGEAGGVAGASTTPRARHAPGFPTEHVVIRAHSFRSFERERTDFSGQRQRSFAFCR